MRTIEIDFQVHQKIELERKGFSETANDVLRRVFDLGGGVLHKEVDKKPWIWKSVSLPHGTKLKMEYNGVTHRSDIEDGCWMVNGQTASSPSDAAKIVAQTRDGKKPSLNGWIYWHFKTPESDQWIPISTMRKSQS